jgi:murein DD-endopeptidase MepM/ murein hydrolase activator NlpD
MPAAPSGRRSRRLFLTPAILPRLAALVATATASAALLLAALAIPTPGIAAPVPTPSCSPGALTTLCPTINPVTTPSTAPLPIATPSLPQVGPGLGGSAPTTAIASGGALAGATGATAPGPMLSAADAEQVRALFGNQPFVDELVNILGNPTSKAPPTLAHFTLARRSATATSSLGPIPLPPPPPADPTGNFVVLSGLLSGGVASLLLLRAKSVVAAAAATSMLLGGGGAAVTGAHVEQLARPVPPAVTTAGGITTAPVTTSDVRSPGPSWNRLVTLDSQIADVQGRLAVEESELRRLSIPDEGRDQVVEYAPRAGRVNLAPRVAELVAEHDRDQGRLKALLADEYSLYQAASGDRAVRAELVAGATATGSKQVVAAVDQDLTVADAQRQQEAAIQAAIAQLQGGGLSPVQVQAIATHQPFVVPLDAPMSQPFGPNTFSLEPPVVYGGTFYPHFHTGIDLAAPQGTPVRAAADGVVVIAGSTVDATGRLVGYGNYVVIAHNDGYMTVYGHLLSLAVHKGDTVHQGDVIGQEGMSGTATGPHLHFEIRKDGQYVNPAEFLKDQLHQ